MKTICIYATGLPAQDALLKVQVTPNYHDVEGARWDLQSLLKQNRPYNTQIKHGRYRDTMFKNPNDHLNLWR